MAKMRFPDLDEYIGSLERINRISRGCVGRAIYQGAKVVADAVMQNIENLPIDNRRVKEGQLLHGITQQQKDGLIKGFGIAPMEEDGGYRHVKLGFDGYNDVVTARFPIGQPNSMIARSVNSGSYFRQRIPFVDDAVRKQKANCEEKMKETFDQELGKAVK